MTPRHKPLTSPKRPTGRNWPHRMVRRLRCVFGHQWEERIPPQFRAIEVEPGWFNAQRIRGLWVCQNCGNHTRDVFRVPPNAERSEPPTKTL